MGLWGLWPSSKGSGDDLKHEPPLVDNKSNNLEKLETQARLYLERENRLSKSKPLQQQGYSKVLAHYNKHYHNLYNNLFSGDKQKLMSKSKPLQRYSKVLADYNKRFLDQYNNLSLGDKQKLKLMIADYLRIQYHCVSPKQNFSLFNGCSYNDMKCSGEDALSKLKLSELQN